jgi:hypothetical protein
MKNSIIVTAAEPLPFVETRFARRVWQTINYARKYGKITFVFGESQIGKTSAILEYQRRTEGAHYVRMPSSPTLRLFVHDFAAALGAPERLTFPQRRRYIFNRLSRSDVVIVDEAHQAILTERGLNPTQAKIFEFIREVYDLVGCGITLCSTNVFETEMTSGALSGVLAQCNRRSLVTFHCPSRPSAADLSKFAEAHGLPEITDEAKAEQADVVKRECLGVWLTVLRMGCEIAASQGRDVQWSDVVKAKRERDIYNARA